MHDNMEELLEKQRILALQQEKIFGTIRELTTLESDGSELLQSVADLLTKSSPVSSPVQDRGVCNNEVTATGSVPTSESITFISETINKLSMLNNEQKVMVTSQAKQTESAHNNDNPLFPQSTSVLKENTLTDNYSEQSPREYLKIVHVPSPRPRSPSLARTSDLSTGGPQIQITPWSGKLAQHDSPSVQRSPRNPNNIEQLSTCEVNTNTLTPRQFNQGISFVQVSTTYAPGESQHSYLERLTSTDVGSAISFKQGNLSPRSAQNDISFQKVVTTDSLSPSRRSPSNTKNRSPQSISLHPSQLVNDDISFQQVLTERSSYQDGGKHHSPHLSPRSGISPRSGHMGGDGSPSPRLQQNDIDFRKLITTSSNKSTPTLSPRFESSKASSPNLKSPQDVRKVSKACIKKNTESPQSANLTRRVHNTVSDLELGNRVSPNGLPLQGSQEIIPLNARRSSVTFTEEVQVGSFPSSVRKASAEFSSPVSCATTSSASSSSISSSHSYKRPGSIPRINLNIIGGAYDLKQQSNNAVCVNQTQDVAGTQLTPQHAAEIDVAAGRYKHNTNQHQPDRYPFSSQMLTRTQMESSNPSIAAQFSEQHQVSTSRVPGETFSSTSRKFEPDSSEQQPGLQTGDEILQILSTIVGSTGFPTKMSLDTISGIDQQRVNLVSELRSRKPDGAIDITQVESERQCQLLEQSNDLKNLQLQLVESVVSGMHPPESVSEVTMESLMLETPAVSDIRDKIVLCNSPPKKNAKRRTWDQSTILPSDDLVKNLKFDLRLSRVPYNNGSRTAASNSTLSPPASPRPPWITSTRLPPSPPADWSCDCQGLARKTQALVTTNKLKRVLDGIIKDELK